MVIVVYFLSPDLRKNYIYYFKLNITLADLLVGINCLLVLYIEMKISSFEQIPGMVHLVNFTVLFRFEFDQ